MDWVNNLLLVANKINQRLAATQGTLGLVGGEDIAIVVVAATVEVDAVITHKGSQPFQHDTVPLRPASLTAAHQLNARIRPEHDFGKLDGLLPIILGTQHSDLPS